MKHFILCLCQRSYSGSNPSLAFLVLWVLNLCVCLVCLEAVWLTPFIPLTMSLDHTPVCHLAIDWPYASFAFMNFACWSVLFAEPLQVKSDCIYIPILCVAKPHLWLTLLLVLVLLVKAQFLWIKLILVPFTHHAPYVTPSTDLKVQMFVHSGISKTVMKLLWKITNQ